jgi:hypothetical protein
MMRLLGVFEAVNTSHFSLHVLAVHGAHNLRLYIGDRAAS